MLHKVDTLRFTVACAPVSITRRQACRSTQPTSPHIYDETMQLVQEKLLSGIESECVAHPGIAAQSSSTLSKGSKGRGVGTCCMAHLMCVSSEACPCQGGTLGAQQVAVLIAELYKGLQGVPAEVQLGLCGMGKGFVARKEAGVEGFVVKVNEKALW